MLVPMVDVGDPGIQTKTPDCMQSQEMGSKDLFSLIKNDFLSRVITCLKQMNYF